MTKALVVMIDKNKVAEINDLMSLSIKEAVGELENLPADQIRGFLTQAGIINDRFRLREVMDASLALYGDDEHSAVIAALEPTEIGGAVNSSPEVFESGRFFLFSQADYSRPEMWTAVSLEEKDAILASGDKKLIARLRNLHLEPWTREGMKIGPWVMFKHEIAVIPEIIFGYLSAIKNADRDEEWKDLSVREIGLELVAYCANSMPEITDELREISPLLLKAVEEMRLQPGLRYDACEKFMEGKTFMDSAAASIQLSGDESLDRMMAELRQMGIANPTAEDVEMLAEVNNGLGAVFKNGFPLESQ